ncbi:hypothetical protein, partial [Pseudomonas sp. SWRI179]|uniref:hypothetical protein n=1 Tax=Pseudomonas sp. SWRI179 TaxID=2745497 RepID=UPI001EE32A82
MFVHLLTLAYVGARLARDDGLTAGLALVDWVHIHFRGNGGLRFRPDGGSLLKSPEAGPVKSKQNAPAP